MYSTLGTHYNGSEKTNYALSEKLADYIFFPLSGLLRSPSLSSEITKYVLDIIAFLVNHAWRHKIEDKLIDQLAPLVVVLCRRDGETDFHFKNAGIDAICAIVECFPMGYFAGTDLAKRLSALGDCTTILMEGLVSFPSPMSQDDNDRAIKIMETTKKLYITRVSSEQTSHVFPGIVSKIVTFVLSAKNVRSRTALKAIQVIASFVTKVFADQSLNIVVEKSGIKIESLPTLHQQEGPNLPLAIEIPDKGSHRTASWLKATSSQLKMSLVPLFRLIILNHSWRSRLLNNKGMQELIIDFVKEVVEHCFQSLFLEQVSLCIDVLSTLLYVLPDGEESMESWCNIFMDKPFSQLELLLDLVTLKSQDLVQNHLEPVLTSSNDEKIGICLCAIRFHLHLQSELTKVLNKDMSFLKSLKQHLVLSIQNQILTSLENGFRKPKVEQGLSNMKLPSHINLEKLVKLSPEPVLVTTSPTDLANLRNFERATSSGPILYLTNLYTSETEQQISKLLKSLPHGFKLYEMVQHLLYEGDSNTKRGIALWIARIMYENAAPSEDFSDIIDFDMAVDDTLEQETKVTILEAAQSLLSDSVDNNRSSGSNRELSFATALSVIGTLAKSMSKEAFQTLFLMDLLYFILEALTYSSDGMIHISARNALDSIVDAHYGSLEGLIMQNSDYLIDSLSIRLSTSSGLTPALPGILLIVLKILGIELLKSNQLQDVLSEIFIVVDNFHAYSVLVHNFFLVFEEVMNQLDMVYGSKLPLLTMDRRPFRPWGMMSEEEMEAFVSKENKQIQSFEDYDLTKEYFKAPGVPFGEAVEAGDRDSDDEEEASNEEPEPEEAWPSPIEKPTYASLQQICTYGLQLLTHPSVKLRIQILRTLRRGYPMLCSNYTATMPLLAQYWPLLLTLVGGTETLSESSPGTGHEQLIVPCAEFLMCVFEEDARRDRFMSRRFIEMWEHLKKTQTSPTATVTSLSAVVQSRMVPKVRDTLVSLLLTGVNVYERSVPDLMVYDIVRHCAAWGIKNQTLGREAQNALRALKFVESVNNHIIAH